MYEFTHLQAESHTCKQNDYIKNWEYSYINYKNTCLNSIHVWIGNVSVWIPGNIHIWIQNTCEQNDFVQKKLQVVGVPYLVHHKCRGEKGEGAGFLGSTPSSSWLCFNTLQHMPQHAALQHSATHCNTLQHIATHSNTQNGERSGIFGQHDLQASGCAATRCNSCCNTLQHIAAHCNTKNGGMSGIFGQHDLQAVDCAATLGNTRCNTL